MKFLIVIFSLFIPEYNLFGQNWKLVGKTNISFSNFIHSNEDNWQDYSYECFKRNDSLLILEKNLSRQFFELFQESPSAFEDIFKEAYYNGKLDSIRCRHTIDSVILKNSYNNEVIISGVEEVDGYNELIWIVNNTSGNCINFCFFNMCFLKNKDANNNIKLKYVSSKKSSCQF